MPKVLMAFKDQLEHRELKAQPELKARPVRKDPSASKGLLVRQDRLARLVPRVRLVRLVLRVLMASRARQVLRVLKAQQVLRVLKARPVLKVWLEPKVLTVRKDLSVCRDRPAQLEHKDLRDPKVPKGRLARKAQLDRLVRPVPLALPARVGRKVW